MTSSRYADFPDHPLRDVPQSVLDVARKPVRDAAEYKDVDPEMADSIADAVVAQLAQHGYLKLPPPVTGLVFVPPSTSDAEVAALRERWGPGVEVRVERHPDKTSVTGKLAKVRELIDTHRQRGSALAYEVRTVLDR